MSLSSSVSLHYVAGNTVTLEFAVTDENDDAASIAGDTIRFILVDSDSQIVLSTEESGSSVTTEATNPSGGIFTVTIEDESTAALSGTYRFQAELEDALGDKTTVARGFLTFSPNLFSSAS